METIEQKTHAKFGSAPRRKAYKAAPFAFFQPLRVASKVLLLPLAVAGLGLATSAHAGSDEEKKHGHEKKTGAKTVVMNAVTKDGTGRSFGEVEITQTKDGLVFSPNLQGLSPGLHGFHVHENHSCEPTEKDGEIVPGGGAGSHFDPKKSEHHDAPWADGHMGDLPALFVDDEGNAEHPLLAPRLKLKQIKNRALVIHAEGDNYSDDPKPLGGGGSRVACGLIK